jgi:hypothetical protein
MVNVTSSCLPCGHLAITWSDNFRMNTGMVDMVPLIIWLVFIAFKEELSLLPKNPTEAKLQATSTWGESTEPT